MTTTGRRPRLLVAHPSAELYGSDRVALETVIALVEAGWEVVVALAADGPLRRELEAAGARVVVLPVPVLRKSALSPAGAVRLAWESLRSTGGLRRLLRQVRPDAVYVSTVTVPLWLVASRLAGRPVICHVHEAEQDVPRVVRVGLAVPLLLARLVVANSEASRDVLVGALPRLRGRTRIVDNGVPGPGAPRPPRERLDPPVRLVLVGRISPRKGTDVAVRALAALRAGGVDAVLTLVGGVFAGYEWFEREVRDLARELGVAQGVTFAGVLPSVWGPLAEADVALVPSRVEPFGNAAVEALLAGRPVVVGDTQGLREIVRPGVDGERVPPGDAEALAAAVRRIVDDWPGAVTRAAAARAEAQERFAPERYRRTMASLVAEVAGVEAVRAPSA